MYRSTYADYGISGTVRVTEMLMRAPYIQRLPTWRGNHASGSSWALATIEKRHRAMAKRPIRTMAHPLTGISVMRFWAESILPSPAAYAGVHVNRAGISARSRQKDEMRLVNFSPIRSGVRLREQQETGSGQSWVVCLMSHDRLCSRISPPSLIPEMPHRNRACRILEFARRARIPDYCVDSPGLALLPYCGAPTSPAGLFPHQYSGRDTRAASSYRGDAD